ncbi:MAG: hypothetical protein Q9176_007784 [Flavoplaca citrina]
MPPVSSCGSCPDRHCRANPQPKPTLSYQQHGNQRPEESNAPSKQYSIREYRNQEDQHQAFLVGASTSSSRSPLDMRRELNQWENKWQRMCSSQPGNKANDLPFRRGGIGPEPLPDVQVFVPTTRTLHKEEREMAREDELVRAISKSASIGPIITPPRLWSPAE